MNPILQHGDITFVFVRFNNLYMVATTNKNSNVMMITSFMHKLGQVCLAFLLRTCLLCLRFPKPFLLLVIFKNPEWKSLI